MNIVLFKFLIFAFKPEVCEMDGNFCLQNELKLLFTGIAVSKKRHALVSALRIVLFSKSVVTFRKMRLKKKTKKKT